MKKSEIISIVAGIGLFVLAAVFSISLLLALPGVMLTDANRLYLMGIMFTDVYGWCSALIPVFLIVAGIQCFNPRWNIKRGVILLGSVVPFFTADALEHVCRIIAGGNVGPELGIKLTTALLIGAVVLGVEYFLLAMLGDTLQHIFMAQDDDRTEDISDEDDEEIAALLAETDIDADADESLLAENDAVADQDDAGEIDGEADEDEIMHTPATLANGEDNPFLHVFDTAVHEKNELPAETVAETQPVLDETPAEDNPSLPEEMVVPVTPQYNEDALKFLPADEEPEELVELDSFDPDTDSFADTEMEESATIVEDIADELDWLTEDESPAEVSLADGEPDYAFDDDMISEEEAALAERADQAAFDDEAADDTAADYEPVMDADDEIFEDEVLEPNLIDFEDDHDEELPEVESIGFDEAFIDDDPIEEPDEPEAKKPSLEEIFAEMDADAADDPVFAEEKTVISVAAAPETVDPLAPPVVDADGQLFAQHEPPVFDDEPADPQSEQDDFSAEDERVVRLESPAPLVEEPKIEKRRIRGPYKIPTDLLDTYSNGEYWLIDEETKQAASDLKDTLSEFKIEAEVTGIRKGPVVTMFEILPAPGVKLSKIVALQDNIALRLAASSVRIVAPIPGKHAVGIEVPNKERAVVSFKEIVDLDLPQFSKMAIPVILGKDISGEPRVLDLAKTPHLLIAGSTGAGKSVCVNSMILSILYKRSPQDVKLIMIDPKVVELKLYNDIPHLLTPVITESKRAFQSLQYCLCEMERRYACLDGMGVRDIASYNKRIVERNIAAEKLPYIVVIIDEFADLMATTGKELESTIARLAAMSRAVGIHLVLATQRPSIDVITGLIKANIPSRIAFMVASKMDSRIIIDQVGAEKLLGKGDMLFASATDPFPVRIQGTLVNDNEVEHVVEFVKQYGEPEYIDDEIFVDDDDDDSSGPGLFGEGDDPLYDEALQIVMQAGKASASYIQRRLKIGYNRAARLVEEMEERGIVGPANGSKPREVICVP